MEPTPHIIRQTSPMHLTQTAACNLPSITATTVRNFNPAEQFCDIDYQFIATPFGEVIAASTAKGIFYCHFVNDRNKAIAELKRALCSIKLCESKAPVLQAAERFFQHPLRGLHQLRLHLTGTAFQLSVWQALLRIPAGELRTYSQVAESIQRPKAARAVGTAIGQNSIAVLIPCHRVIKASGHLGSYRWGEERKAALIDWEARSTDQTG